MTAPKKYIITGGPGAGKTSLLGALKNAGYSCSEEVSRQLIREEVASHSQCLPWTNLPCFANKVLDRMVAHYHQTAGNGITFFDRGIPDIIAYLKAAALPVPDRFYTALQQHPYQSQVFILPPWEHIYVHDSERWQTYEEAVQLYTFISETYRALGFTLIAVPAASMENRMERILENLGEFKKQL